MLNIQTPMASHPTPVIAQQQKSVARDFHGAAIIDASGREIPMTAEMIDSALEKLSAQWDRQCGRGYPYNLAI
jgi:hypothetical protein